MFKVVDQVTGTAVKIEIIGKPYQYQVRVGKIGTWTIARGRTAGTVKTGEKWGHPQFYSNLKQAISCTLSLISEEEGIPENAIVLDGSEAWKVLIEQENKRMAMVEAVGKEFQKLLDEHGKDLAGLSKLLAAQKGVVGEEDEEEADDSVVEESNEEGKE
jgi:hypothetical protein